MYFPMMVFMVGVGGLVLLYNQLYLEEDLSPAEEWAELVGEAVEKTVDMSSAKAKKKKVGCHFYNSDCFDVYRCGKMNGRLKGKKELCNYQPIQDTQIIETYKSKAYSI